MVLHIRLVHLVGLVGTGVGLLVGEVVGDLVGAVGATLGAMVGESFRCETMRDGHRCSATVGSRQPSQCIKDVDHLPSRRRLRRYHTLPSAHKSEVSQSPLHFSVRM
jgi:hypothetical protein